MVSLCCTATVRSFLSEPSSWQRERDAPLPSPSPAGHSSSNQLHHSVTGGVQVAVGSSGESSGESSGGSSGPSRLSGVSNQLSPMEIAAATYMGGAHQQLLHIERLLMANVRPTALLGAMCTHTVTRPHPQQPYARIYHHLPSVPPIPPSPLHPSAPCSVPTHSTGRAAN